MKISVVIPCYNEEKSIGMVIDSIPKEVSEIIVVDNNCTDRSAEIARSHGARVVIEHRAGYGYAHRAGFAAVQGDIIATLDADGQYPAQDIPKIAHYLSDRGLDFINTTRFPMQNKTSLSFTRKMGNFLLTLATNALFQIKTKDSQSGMWVFKKSILKKFKLESGDMPMSEELKIKAATHPEIKYKEYSINYEERLGESKLFPLKHGTMNLAFLFYLRFKSPFKFVRSKSSLTSILGIITILILFSSIALKGISSPFVHVSEDTNGMHGVALLNIINLGGENMKFGLYPRFLNTVSEIPNRGGYYTHHPIGFFMPTLALYKLFGVSETTTRFGPFLLTFLSIILLFLALTKFFPKKSVLPFFITLTYSLLPGTLYYGKHLDMTPPALALALITFSLFILHIQTKKHWIWWAMIGSILLGGTMGWHYYFIIPGIYLLLLLPQTKKIIEKRSHSLIAIPIATIIPIAATLIHFVILRGGALTDLLSAFGGRSAPQILGPWLSRIWWGVTLNATTFFVIAAIIGLVILLVKMAEKNKTYMLLSPLFVMPILSAATFMQWSTHPFGTILMLPAIAISSGMIYEEILKKNRKIGTAIICMVIFIGGIFSLKNYNYFMNEFLILGTDDIQLFTKLGKQMKGADICMGTTPEGIYMGGIAEWYAKKEFVFMPECEKDQNIKGAVIFLNGPQQVNKKEYEIFTQKGMKPAGCANRACLLLK